MHPPPDLAAGRARFRQFLAGPTAERVFYHATGHPSQPTGFCPCDGGVLARWRFYARAWLQLMLLRQAFNRPKLILLRQLGAHIGRNVYLSADVWIDPTFPELLTIEDDVLVGVGARIALHEFGRDYFQAGRVRICQGAVIGGFALIRHGVEIGAGAVVAGGAVVARDVPAGKLAVGNPARILPLTAARDDARTGGTHA